MRPVDEIRAMLMNQEYANKYAIALLYDEIDALRAENQILRVMTGQS